LEEMYVRVARLELPPLLAKLAPAEHARKLSVKICYCGPGNDQQRMRMLGQEAASYVRTLIRRSESCGLTWGGTLEAVVAGLRQLPHPSPWNDHDVEFVPLSGEPLGKGRHSFASSSLARELGSIVNKAEYDPPSLAMVPAFVPDIGFEETERSVVWKLIELVEDYLKIFGPHDNDVDNPRYARLGTPKAMGLDMILTSVGSSEHPLGFGRGILFDHMRVTYHALTSLLAAEVGGVCIPKPNLTAVETRQLSTVQGSWTGLRLEHLEACARRVTHAHYGPPGVVVISGGSKRADAVREMIRQGLVNHLIVDEVLAKELNLPTQVP